MGAILPSNTAAGTSGQVQYNSGGYLAGASGAKINADGTLNATPEVIDVTVTSKTLALTDANTIQDCSNASTQTITIPLNATVAFDTNTLIYFEKNGAGNVTIQAVTGVTLNGTDGGAYAITSPAQTGMVYIRKDGTNAWILQSAATTTGLTANAIIKGGGAGVAAVASGVTIDSSDTMYGYKGKINPQTGTTYTLQASDAGKIVECSNASAITVTLPNSLAVGFCCTVSQTGAGQVSFSAAVGATLRNKSSFTKISGQYGVVSLYVTTNSDGSSAVYMMAGDGAT